MSEDSESSSVFDVVQNLIECALCLSMVCEPISISCGHTFCRVCLVKSLRRSKKKCPSCRSVCHIVAEDAQENIMIKNIALSINPFSYQMRLAEAELEKSTWTSLLPVFYYNQCLFPGSKLSLHLFEPRYKVMMQRVVNSTRSFAYVPNFTNYSAGVGDIALIATLEEVEFLPDGRCLLEAKLTARCLITEQFVEEGTQGLHFVRLEDLNDVVMDELETTRAIELKNMSTSLLSMVIEPTVLLRLEKTYGPAPSSLVGYSLWLTSMSPMSEGDKLNLLKSTNTLARYESAILGFTNILQRVGRSNIESRVLQGQRIIPSTPTAAGEDEEDFVDDDSDEEEGDEEEQEEEEEAN